MYLGGEWMNMWNKRCMKSRDSTSTMDKCEMWNVGEQFNK